MNHRQLMRLPPAQRQAIMLARNPVWRAAHRAPMPQTLQTDRQIEAEAAYDEIIHGRGHPDHVEALGIAANVSLILAEWGYGPECEPKIIDAQQAIMRTKARMQRGQGIGFDGPGIQAMVDMLATHAQQLEHAGQETVSNAVIETYQRQARGLVMKVAA